MRISQIQSNLTQPKLHSAYMTNTNSAIKSGERANFAAPVSFYGDSIFLLDGGQHADDLYYFAKALDKDFDLTLMPIEQNPKDPRIKQMKSLKENLELINKLPPDKRPDYIAIPMGSHVSLQNLSNQMHCILGRDVHLNPQNTNLSNEGRGVMRMLEILAKYPDDNRRYINALDPLGQGIEYTYDVIKEINKAVANGIKVYTPAGHPIENSVKWLARDRHLKPEFYYYISHGEDINNTVHEMAEFVQNNNWYDFNLLSLSNAEKVALQTKNNKNHLFTAFDSCVTRKARGVYNFTPVRENGELKGFSFTDEKTVEYPVNKYKMIKNIENLLEYVGKNIDETAATRTEIDNYKSYLNGDWRFTKEDFKGKLFPVEEVFSPEEIKKQRIYLQGEYTDAERKLFFSTRDDGTILFNKCNYEQSAKPSVVSMWGCCFSIFNAIKEDIDNSK